jgi:hypothetical protein
MAKNQLLFFTKTAKQTGVTFVNADGTAVKSLYTAPAQGAKVRAISICSDDTTNRDALIYLSKSGTNYVVGNVDVPLGSGTNGTVNGVNGLNTTNLPWTTKDNNYNPYIELEAGESLKASMLTAVTAAKTVTIVVLSEEYE